MIFFLALARATIDFVRALQRYKRSRRNRDLLIDIMSVVVTAASTIISGSGGSGGDAS
jgi:hypothetical protein